MAKGKGHLQDGIRSGRTGHAGVLSEGPEGGGRSTGRVFPGNSGWYNVKGFRLENMTSSGSVKRRVL